MNNTQVRQANKYQHAAAICLIIAAILPISSWLAMVGLSLAVVLWLHATPFSELKHHIAQSTLAKCSLALFVVIALSALYSNASTKWLLKTIVAYRDFLFLPITICILGVLPQYKKTVINFLIITLTIVVILSYLDANHPLPFSKSTQHGAVNDHYIFLQHITQNVMSSFLVLLLLMKTVDQDVEMRWRIVYFILAVMTIGNILFMVRGRTGILTLILNLFIFGYYHLSIKQRWLAAAFAALCMAWVFMTENPLNKLIQHTVHEIEVYNATGQDTSAGLRLAFWQDTWNKIEQNPIFGYGAGSYREMYDLDVKNPDKPGYSAGKYHPHNELLLIWFEAGIIGAALFLLFVATLIKMALKAQELNTKMLRFSVVAMVVIYCFFDAPFLNHVEGMFFWLLISVLFTVQPTHCVEEK